MNHEFAREVGYPRFILRKLAWRVGCAPRSLTLATGVEFPLPRGKAFASDVYVTNGNVDWCSEFILAEYLRQRTERGDFLDVGAHIGYYSILLAPVVERCFAFEPDTRNQKLLREALAPFGNAEVVAKAVSARSGRALFASDGDSSTSHLDPESNEGDRSEVETTSIDDFVKEHNLQAAAVKIDIEGYDILALEGAMQIAAAGDTVFLVEFNQEAERPNSWDRLEAFLVEAGLVAYCVSRSFANGGDYEYTFRRHSVRDISSLSTKMIFLVPPGARDWFEKFHSKCGSWKGSEMRKRGWTGRLRAVNGDGDDGKL